MTEMMKKTWLAILILAAITVACTNEDAQQLSDTTPQPAQATVMHLMGGVTPFDASAVTRAADEWEWQDGAVLYLQFYNGSERIRSYAVYSKSSNTWEVPTWVGTIGTKDKCEVYYFEGASTTNKENVALGATVGVYGDAEASYIYDSGVVNVFVALKPMTSRIRFLRGTGTDVSSITLDGVNTYTAYDATTNTLTVTDESVSASVGSTGYTDYIYGNFTNTSTRQLDIRNNVDGAYTHFLHSFDSNVLQTAHSGYITIPTVATNKGWTLEKETSGFDNGHEWVDLGLSVHWASCNVGASRPEEYGDYYAWGETSTKSEYTWSTYKHCQGSNTTMTKYCTSATYGNVDNKTTLEGSDDVAKVKWGGSWRLPTYDELNELNTKCTWTWTTKNGVKGYEVKGPNGNIIFLPAAGYRSGTSLSNAGSNGSCWSSSLYTTIPFSACYFNFYSSDHSMSSYGRSVGVSVRPVLGP